MKQVPWCKSVEFPSALQMAHMKKFFTSFDWWNLRPGFWEAEFFIPWTVFEATPPKAGESWNANVVVNRHSEPEESSSTSFTLNNNSNLGMFGLINFDVKCD